MARELTQFARSNQRLIAYMLAKFSIMNDAQSLLEPELGLRMPVETVVILLAWFGVCLFLDKDVANAAHAGGLVAGVFIGAAPRLWRG